MTDDIILTNNGNDLKDCKGRDMDSVFLYWGYDSITEVDEFAMINHLYKARTDSQLPKFGNYCMVDEFFGNIVDKKYSTILNKNFRNVQYIQNMDRIYWIYCLNINNLYKFKFIGNNVSVAIARTLLLSHEFELGFRLKKRHKLASYTGSFDPEKFTKSVDVWYSSKKLKMFIMHYVGCDITHRKMYYRKFETNDMVSTPYTNKLFESGSICIPLIDEYVEDDDLLYWTCFVDVSPNNQYDIINPLHRSDYDANSLYFDKGNYDEMLKYLFNKR